MVQAMYVELRTFVTHLLIIMSFFASCLRISSLATDHHHKTEKTKHGGRVLPNHHTIKHAPGAADCG
jgi:hypothetical protein